MPSMATILLPITLVILFLFLRKDGKQYEAFKALTETSDRQRVFRNWVVKSFLMLGVTSLIGLWLLGELLTLWTMPTAFENVLPDLKTADGEEQGELSSFLGGMLSALKFMAIPALLFGGILGAVLRAKMNGSNSESSSSEPQVVGDIEPMMPRNSSEKFWAAMISINAGFSEELFFRLFLPLLFWMVFGNALLAFAICSILFGLAHYYQGPVGILATTIFGVVMLFIYLVSQSIWLVVGVHIINDINALIVCPWVTERMNRSPNELGNESAT